MPPDILRFVDTSSCTVQTCYSCCYRGKDSIQNFSWQYQYYFKKTSDKNKEKYQLRGYELIQYQILRTDIRIVWETVRRITNEILGVKGLMWYPEFNHGGRTKKIKKH